MQKSKNTSGASSILIVLILAAVLLVLFSTIGNVFQSLNRASNDLTKYSDSRNVTFDMGQFVLDSYSKAVATGPGLPTCDADSAAHLVVAGGFYMCFPTALFCSQYNATYCLASPYVVSEYQGDQPPQFVIRPERTRNEFSGIWIRMLSPSKALANPPDAWLPDIVANPSPNLQIASPTCATTTGADIECIRCGGASQNARCLKVRFCTNSTATCAAGFIEPVFAIQTNYGP